MIPALSSLNSPFLLDYFFRKKAGPRYFAAVDKVLTYSKKKGIVSSSSSLCSSLDGSPFKTLSTYGEEENIHTPPQEFCLNQQENDCSSKTSAEQIFMSNEKESNNQLINSTVESYTQNGCIEDTHFISCVIEPSQKLGGLYISDIDSAKDLEALKQYGISQVLSIDRNTSFTLPLSINQKHVIAFDTEIFQLKKYFSTCNEFILSGIQKGENVLVHCQRGVSRSAAIVICFLMKSYQYSFLEAFEFLKKRRPVINPNKGFITQLQTYEKFIKEFNRYQTPSIQSI